MEYFNPISAVIEGTGALFNSSKKRFVWRFELDLEEHSVELECSFLTNKRRVTYDGNLIYKGIKALWSNDFQYQFKQKTHIITVYNHRNDANLLVDSLSFDILYSKKILGQVKSFGNKEKGPGIEKKMHWTESESVANAEKGPKPARFLSDEEYEKAVSLSRTQIGPKKSLRDILEKNNIEKSETGKNRDLISLGDEKNIELFDWDGFKSNRSEKVVISEDFLNLGPEQKVKKEEFFGKNEINEDLFQFDLVKSPSLNENFRNNNFGENFLDLEPSKPKNSDFGSGTQTSLKKVGDDFLSLDGETDKKSLIFDEPESIPKNLDFLDLDSEKNIYKSAQILKTDEFLMENYEFKVNSPISTFSNPSTNLKQDLLFEEFTPNKVQATENKPSQYPTLDIFSPVPVAPELKNPSHFSAPSHLSITQTKSNKDFDSVFS